MAIYKFSDFQNQFVQMIIKDIESPQLLDDIIPAGKLKSSVETMRVHQNGYIARLTEALGETFEGTWFSMGDELFFEVCEQYICNHHSSEYNLSNYGYSFPYFIGELKNSINIPFIQDMARFDWIFKELFHEKQHDSVPLTELLKIHENPHLKLEFGNAVKLFSSQNAVYKIWDQRKKEQEDIVHFDFENPEFVILYKDKNSLFSKEITEFQFDILTKFKNGLSLDAVIEDSNIENQQDFLEIFHIIVTTKIISRVY